MSEFLSLRNIENLKMYYDRIAEIEKETAERQKQSRKRPHPIKTESTLEAGSSKMSRTIDEMLVMEDSLSPTDNMPEQWLVTPCEQSDQNDTDCQDSDSDDEFDPYKFYPAKDYLQPSYVSYKQDTHDYMIKKEIYLKQPSPTYMKKQPELTAAMRSSMVDWFVKVSIRYKLQQSSIHLAVHLLDTFLSTVTIKKDKFILLACTAMMVACKHEEKTYPLPSQWVSMAGKKFSKNKILKMERAILKLMAFDMSWPTVHTFIMHMSYFAEVFRKETILALYIAELMIKEGDMYLTYRPSFLASGAMLLARHTLKKLDLWPNDLKLITGHTLIDLLPLLELAHQTLCDSPDQRDQTSRIKYSVERMDRVGLLTPQPLNLLRLRRGHV